jgi:hypothetical protein
LAQTVQKCSLLGLGDDPGDAIRYVSLPTFNLMAPKLDPAIIKALSLDAAITSIASHGGSGFSSTAKLTTQIHGEEKIYFIKTGNGQDAETMFEGEYSILIARCLGDS